MAVTVFKDASYDLAGLLSRIEHGDIALPDIRGVGQARVRLSRRGPTAHRLLGAPGQQDYPTARNGTAGLHIGALGLSKVRESRP